MRGQRLTWAPTLCALIGLTSLEEWGGAVAVSAGGLEEGKGKRWKWKDITKGHEIKNGYNKHWENIKWRTKQEFVKKQRKTKANRKMEIKGVKAKQEMQNKKKRKSDTVIWLLELEQILSGICHYIGQNGHGAVLTGNIVEIQHFCDKNSWIKLSLLCVCQWLTLDKP